MKPQRSDEEPEWQSRTVPIDVPRSSVHPAVPPPSPSSLPLPATETMVGFVPPKSAASPRAPYLLVIAGEHAGMMLRVPDSEFLVIGRDPAADLTIPDDLCSRRHARLYASSDGQVLLEDLGSTNGTLVNGSRVDQPWSLRDGDRIYLGSSTVLKFSLQDELEEQFQAALYRSATRDPLTGVYNKRFFLETLEREVRHHVRQSLPLSLVIYDLDHFKKVNDTHGHLAGDEVLKVVAKVVGECVRGDDVLARYGGEEFAIILPGTPLVSARLMADRFRERVAATKIPLEPEGSLSVTCSVGIASVGAETATPTQLIADADERLYRAKHEGRNCVRV